MIDYLAKPLESSWHLHARQRIYADFLAAIHAMFVRVIRAEKELRGQHVARLSKFVKLKLPLRDAAMLQAAPVSAPSCPAEADGIYISTRLDAEALQSLSKSDQNVHNFILNFQWVMPQTFSSLGTTWLELLLAYISHGWYVTVRRLHLKVSYVSAGH